MGVGKNHQPAAEVADEIVDVDGDTIDTRPAKGKRGYPIRLLTLENVRAEMARVYRACRAGQMETKTGSSLNYQLSQLKIVIEAIADNEHAERILEIETRLGLAKALGGGNVRQLKPAAAPAAATPDADRDEEHAS